MEPENNEEMGANKCYIVSYMKCIGKETREYNGKLYRKMVKTTSMGGVSAFRKIGRRRW